MFIVFMAMNCLKVKSQRILEILAKLKKHLTFLLLIKVTEANLMASQVDFRIITQKKLL